jgi:uncharacterized spore protein YtfJ
MPPVEWQKSLAGARDAITVKRVYGAPIERDGVTIIPVARVAGGGGGGGGTDIEGGQGGGTGFGIWAAPVGAYVIREGGEVEWSPAVDRTAIILSAGGVVTAALFALRAALNRRG